MEIPRHVEGVQEHKPDGSIAAWESYAPLPGVSLRGMGLLRESWERFFSLIKERCQGESLCPMSLSSHSGNWAPGAGCSEQLHHLVTMRRHLQLHRRGTVRDEKILSPGGPLSAVRGDHPSPHFSGRTIKRLLSSKRREHSQMPLRQKAVDTGI